MHKKIEIWAIMAGVFMMVAGSARASYVVQTITTHGSFSPLTISDDGTVAGTLTTKGGSLALLTNGTRSKSYDFCGVGQPTVLTATSPYSVGHFLAGTCGSVGFLYDAKRDVVTLIGPTSTSGVDLTAVGRDGLLAGTIDVHSGGNAVFYYRRGIYTAYWPGEFSFATQITLSGLIIGFSENLGGEGYGFTMVPGSPPTVIQPPTPGFGSGLVVRGGNDGGQLATTVYESGTSHAAIWQAGEFRYPQFPSTNGMSQASAINERGDLTGTFWDNNNLQHVFVWHSRTDKMDIVPVPASATDMSVESINNHADITGTYTQSGATVVYMASPHRRIASSPRGSVGGQ